jgi:hypothetical protein
MPVFADDVWLHLDGGESVRGEVIREQDGVIVLRTRYGVLTIPLVDVARRVEPTAHIQDSEVLPRRGASLDKTELSQIQVTLARIQDAINRDDDERLVLLLDPAIDVPVPLALLKERLGLRKVVLRAIHARHDQDGVRATVNVTEYDSAGDAHVRGQELVLREVEQGYVLKAPTGDVEAALHAIDQEEQQAIERLRALHRAQRSFVEQRHVDSDRDGRGEFGFIQELAGVRLRSTREQQRAPIEALIETEMAAPYTRGEGYGELGGYRYVLYLPGDQEALAERGPLPSWLPVHADRSEQYYVAYAWPIEYARTGQRAFVIDQRGRLFFTLGGLYAGGNIPPVEAAFSRQALMPRNALADSRQGVGDPTACDGQLWLPLSSRFERPLPAGFRRLHLIQRLLLARSLLPDDSTPVAEQAPTPTEVPDGELEAKVVLARNEMAALQLALRAYAERHGVYPPSGNRSMVLSLSGGAESGASDRYYPFPFPSERLRDGQLLDPWGRPYRYEAPVAQQGEPLIVSRGPNGHDDNGGGDDLTVR